MKLENFGFDHLHDLGIQKFDQVTEMRFERRQSGVMGIGKFGKVADPHSSIIWVPPQKLTDGRKTESLKGERQENEAQKKEYFPSLDGRLARRKILRQTEQK